MSYTDVLLYTFLVFFPVSVNIYNRFFPEQLFSLALSFILSKQTLCLRKYFLLTFFY